MSSLKEEKVNQLALKFGSKLELGAINMQRSALKTHPEVMSASKISYLLAEEYGYPKRSLYDAKYYLLSIEEWLRFIKYDWVDKKEYFKDRFDCDNFAYLFAARAALMLGVNTAGVAGGIMKKPSGDVPHAYTIIVTKDKKLYAMETQTDKITKVEKGHPIIINGIQYTVNWITLF